MPPLPETRPPPTSPPGASMSKTRPTPSCFSGGLEKEDVLRKKNEDWIKHLPESANFIYMQDLAGSGSRLHIDESHHIKPTRRTNMDNSAYQNVFDHFNVELFNGELPSNLQEEPTFFHPVFGVTSNFKNLAVHMIHRWQASFGSSLTVKEDNTEFTDKMREIGLSYEGFPGHDGIIKGGMFEHTMTKMPIKLKDEFMKATMKVKYTCPACGYSKWCRPGLGKQCNACDAIMKVGK